MPVACYQNARCMHRHVLRHCARYRAVARQAQPPAHRRCAARPHRVSRGACRRQSALLAHLTESGADAVRASCGLQTKQTKVIVDQRQQCCWCLRRDACRVTSPDVHRLGGGDQEGGAAGLLGPGRGALPELLSARWLALCGLPATRPRSGHAGECTQLSHRLPCDFLRVQQSCKSKSSALAVLARASMRRPALSLRGVASCSDTVTRSST